ncbi:MAG TPA: ribosome silencing factor [Polyangiaceae bacterium]|nr:ribosome silencing factor [Polyangiaceae bacterium]
MKARKVTRRPASPGRAGTERRPTRRPAVSDVVESQRLALLAAQAGLEKKASGVEIIDVTGKIDYADYLVIMTGQSDRHVAAIAHAVDELLARSGHRALSVEGLPQARWVLIDLVDFVVHVFLEDARSLYDLDGLWMDARRVPVPESAEARAGGGSVRPGSRGDGPTEEPEEP